MSKMTVNSIFSSIGDIFKPPARISVSEAACKHFHLPEGGRFDIDTTPYMRYPMDSITDRSISSVIFVGPARTGKTLSLISGSLAYVITSNPSDVLVVHMTEAAARKYSRFTIARMIRNSPRLKSLLSESKDDDNILMKFFRNGMGLVIGHPSPTQLSAADYKFVFLSDFDRMPEDNGEGSVFIQAQKRTQTFMSAGCTIVETSPGRDMLDTEWEQTGEHEAPPVGGALGLYNEGDRHLQYWTCPHEDCGEHIRLYPGLDLFQLPDDDIIMQEISDKGTKFVAKKYATMWCPHCGGEITKSQKSTLNATSTWKPESDKPNSTRSFWLSGYAAAFQTWDAILDKEFKGRLQVAQNGDESKLKATRNVDQSIPHMPTGLEKRLTSTELEKRAEESLVRREVPAGARFIIGSVDVQKYKFVCQFEAFGKDNESWIIDRFDLTISNRAETEGSDTKALLQPASYSEDWDILLDTVIQARYQLADGSGRDMGIVMSVCDSHGTDGVTENAYRFWKKVKSLGLSDRFNLVRGLRPRPNATTPYVNRVVLDKSSKSARLAKIIGEQAVWNINTTLYKDMVMANITRDTHGSDYVHFGTWLPSWFYAEILAEHRSDKGWDNPAGKRNEAFDLLAYARAALKIKLLTHWKRDMNWESPPPWANEWDTNSEVSQPDDRSNTKPQHEPKSRERRVRMRSR